jgi:hypothetical protein
MSKFLYHQDMKDFYQNELDKRSCRKTNLLPLLLDQHWYEGARDLKLSAHIASCSDCEKAYRKLQSMNTQISSRIPKKRILKSSAISIEKELLELMNQGESEQGDIAWYRFQRGSQVHPLLVFILITTLLAAFSSMQLLKVRL